MGKPDKLAKFPTDVLPYEATWLQAVQQFRAADNRGILEAIVWRELRQTRATQSPHALI